MELLRLDRVSFTYPGGVPALHQVSLDIREGEFVVLCGPSGGGKTTLLRLLKPLLAPHGALSGEIRFEGRPIRDLTQREQAAQIGFVLQSPEDQTVTHKVWHELAFGLESLGYDTPTIRRRVAEMASFFGIQGWFHRDTDTLSGGQKQLVALASVLALRPRVLLLDEPTAQLDPIAASGFLEMVSKANRELGVTVLLTEHRLEEALPLASRAAVLDDGHIIAQGTPQEVAAALKERGHPMFRAMPTPMRVWSALPYAGGTCPVTVREGRGWLAEYAQTHPLGDVPPARERPAGETVLTAREVWFRYEKDGPQVVRELDLDVSRGELLALLGGNGTGKTTSLRLLAGLCTPQRGRIRAQGRAALLPQEPRALFTAKTALGVLQASEPDREKLREMAALCRLEGLLERHPYDLSGGERQRLALAAVLLTRPDVLLLDEPTRGLDAGFKEILADILNALLARGTAVVMVSHDLEFCAAHASRCALFFDGNIAAQGTPRDFFSGNSFYTTAAVRMGHGLIPGAVTADDLIAACGGENTPEDKPPREDNSRSEPTGEDSPKGALSEEAGSGRGSLRENDPLGESSCRAQLCEASSVPSQTPEKASGKRPVLGRGSVLAAAAVVLLVPFTLWLGLRIFGSRKYYITSLLVLLECMAPFFLLLEGRRARARELVLAAALCALGVVGRQVFFMVPQFKPVLALVILSGAAFGGEMGFLVGAVTMLVSNILFQQGPWTPWQMFAMGLCGFLAGLLFYPSRRPSRLALGVYGIAASVVVYGGIMNLQSALTWSSELTAGILLSSYAAGLPFDLIQGAATFLFLWLAARPMLEKLERIRLKYGLGAPAAPGRAG